MKHKTIVATLGVLALFSSIAKADLIRFSVLVTEITQATGFFEGRTDQFVSVGATFDGYIWLNHKGELVDFTPAHARDTVASLGGFGVYRYQAVGGFSPDGFFVEADS